MNVRLSLSVFFMTLCVGFTQLNAASDSMVCTMEYAPVCGSVQVQCITAPCNPIKQTFSNSCMARASNATNITNGTCESMVPPTNIKMSPREALKSGTWVIESLNGKAIKTAATLKFNKNTFSAKICNTMNGQYGVTSNILIFRKVVSTMMYCDGDIMLVENALHFARAKFMVGANNLTITTKKWDVIVWKKQ